MNAELNLALLFNLFSLGNAKSNSPPFISIGFRAAQILPSYSICFHLGMLNPILLLLFQLLSARLKSCPQIKSCLLFNLFSLGNAKSNSPPLISIAFRLAYEY
jgi:hypothetical protein